MCSYCFEDITDSFGFVKYKGLALCDVLMEDPSYIYWCVNTIPFFTLSEEVLQQIRDLFPKFIITEEFVNHTKSFHDEVDNIAVVDSYNNKYEEEEPTYEKYTGSYAQDEMGYSDDDIDTIFDGDPDAYWNID